MTDESAAVLHDWRGAQVIAYGRRYYGECCVCGRPKPDHPRVDQVMAALVAVVRSVVAEGHYDNSLEGLMACSAYEYGQLPSVDPECDCGWNEARLALDLYEQTQGA